MSEPKKANDDSEMTGMQAPVPETAQVGDEAMIDLDEQVQHEINTPPFHAEEHLQQDSDSLFGSECDPIPPEDPDSLFVPEIKPTPLSNSGPLALSLDTAIAPPDLPSPAPQKPVLTISTAQLRDRMRRRQQKLRDEKRPTAIQKGPNLSHTLASAKSCHLDDYYDETDRRTTEIFEEKMRYYDDIKKAKNGVLPDKFEIEKAKVQRDEISRKKRREHDISKAQEGDSADLAVHPTLDLGQDAEEEEPFDTDFVQPHTRKRVCMQDAELQSMMVAVEARRDGLNNKKKKKKKKNKWDEAKAISKAVQSGKRLNKKQKMVNDGAKQASSLLISDVFDQQARLDAPEQPFFSSRKQKEAMKELLASVPLEDEKQAKDDIASLTKAVRKFSRNAVRPDADRGNLWSVKGMRTSLKAYQLVGSGWMRDRENAAEEPRGGILADQMGLGKTLMTLANIHDGRPPKNSPGPKSTLIVASPALLTQWKSEIEKHSSNELRIMRYGTGTRVESSACLDILRGHDIVLTTYTEVMRSHPKYKPPSDCKNKEEEEAWWMETWEKKRGPLHRVHFLRIVLDEAQAIKNHQSLTSIACRALQADHKWALSGTPILNSLTETYPYFKFLGVPLIDNFDNFEEDYCNPENPEKLLVRLSQFMLRRTHSDKMMGAPILKLPQAHQATYWCKFNPVERRIYDIVQKRFTERMEAMKGGTSEKSYNNILVLYLRLRQLTAHILMLQFVMQDLLEQEDFESIEQVLQQHTADSNAQYSGTIIAVRKQLQMIADHKKKKKCTHPEANKDAGGQDQDSITDEREEEGPQSTHRLGAGGEFGKDYNFGHFLSSLQKGDSGERAKKTAKCSTCGKKPRHPMMISCGHFICAEPCYSEALIERAEQGEENVVCNSCGVIPTYVHACEVETDLEDVPTSGTGSKNKKKGKGHKRPYNEVIPDDWLAALDDHILPSAKTIAVKSQILNWIKENPNVKIIVYTQFLAMVQILRHICQKEGWNSVQYHGKMSFTARDNAIRSFSEQGDIQIMLASMHCGGLGLNLTMASKVIFIDPWWNSAREQQAFCRVFRIGQQTETFMTRFCVKQTIDSKIINIQKRKEEEIECVMEEGGKPVRGMDLEKLMNLFADHRDGAEEEIELPEERGAANQRRDDSDGAWQRQASRLPRPHAIPGPSERAPHHSPPHLASPGNLPRAVMENTSTAEAQPPTTDTPAKKGRRGKRDAGNDDSKKRRCISSACVPCRKRKSKCDGTTPACSACAAVYNTPCIYDPNSDHRRKGVYKKDIDNLKTRNSTLQTLIQAILNYPEEAVADLVQQIRTCESLDSVAEAIIAKENGEEDDDEPFSPIAPPAAAPPEGSFESQLSGKMGELRLEDGSTRYIGGTSHLIYLGKGNDTVDSPDTYSDDQFQETQDPFCSWTTVTSDPELVQHLISMYFCWHYSFFTTLSKNLFLQEFRLGKPLPGSGRKNQYCSPLLVNAMLALGCHFTSWPGARAIRDDSATAGDHFFREAKRLIMEDDLHEVPALTTVQALALMSVREAGCGREAKGWVYSGMSFRMACDLGLNLGMHSKDVIDENEEDARRITFWGCFLFDKCWSNYLGRLPQLPNTILTVPKFDVFPVEDAETWSAVTDSGLSQAHSQPSRTRAVALQISKLCEISSDLMNAFYNPIDMDKAKGRQAELKKLSEIHMRLETWRRELPKELEPKEGGLPHMLVMHMFFQLLYIHLFRPFLKYNPNNSPLPAHVSPRKLCTQAAAMISKLLRLYKRSHGLRQICNICVYIAHSACTIHLLNLPEKNAKRDIIHGVKHLEEIAEGWLCARRTLGILSVLAKRWNVELPEEAATVLSRTDAKFGPWSEVSTPKAQRRASVQTNQHPSPADQASPSLQPYSMNVANMTAPQLYNRTAITNNSSQPPTTPQSYSATLNAPTPASTQGRRSVDGGHTTAGNSPSQLFGGVDQLLREGQDWIYRDQTQLATDFENWNPQGVDDIASWFASTANSTGVFQPTTNVAPITSNEINGGPVGGGGDDGIIAATNGYPNGRFNDNANNSNVNGFGAMALNGAGLQGFTYDEQSWYQ
ncbi:dna repair protein rad5 [Bipolaris maydis]|nr:dna repair protein rad5 [Bipolaris maydis]